MTVRRIKKRGRPTTKCNNVYVYYATQNIMNVLLSRWVDYFYDGQLHKQSGLGYEEKWFCNILLFILINLHYHLFHISSWRLWSRSSSCNQSVCNSCPPHIMNFKNLFYIILTYTSLQALGWSTCRSIPLKQKLIYNISLFLNLSNHPI